MGDRVSAWLVRRGGKPDSGDAVRFACPRCREEARYSERSRRWKCLSCDATGSGDDLVSSGAHQTAPAPIRRPATISAADLARKEFEEPRWAVSGVIPEGLSLLVGPSKRGKSWLMLAACLGIANGGVALGSVPVEAGDVLYLALEDNQRRLQDRQRVLSCGEPLPSRLAFATEWPRQSEGGAEAIDLWLVEHPDARLVVVDVLARFRAHVAGNANAYQADYDAVSTLKTVADRRGVAIVVVHHTRKMGADDPVDTISGTTGLAGAADTLLILQREKSRADAVLYVRGRDVPEAEHALVFDPVTCLWTIAGDAAEFRLSAERAAVLDVLRQSAEPMTPKQIAEALGKRDGAIRVLVRRMAMNGEVIGMAGQYTAPSPPGSEIVQPGEPSGEAPPPGLRSEPLRFDDVELVMHAAQSNEARRPVRRVVVSPPAPYKVRGESSSAARIAYLANGMRWWLQEIVYSERIDYVTIERGGDVLYDSRDEFPVDMERWHALHKDVGKRFAPPWVFEGENEPPPLDPTADAEPMIEPAWAAQALRGDHIEGGAATVVSHCAVLGVSQTEVRRFRINPPATYAQYHISVHIRCTEPRKRNGFILSEWPSHSRYMTVVVGDRVVYDTRDEIPCDMDEWQRTWNRFAGRGVGSITVRGGS